MKQRRFKEKSCLDSQVNSVYSAEEHGIATKTPMSENHKVGIQRVRWSVFADEVSRAARSK